MHLFTIPILLISSVAFAAPERSLTTVTERGFMTTLGGLTAVVPQSTVHLPAETIVWPATTHKDARHTVIRPEPSTYIQAASTWIVSAHTSTFKPTTMMVDIAKDTGRPDGQDPRIWRGPNA